MVERTRTRLSLYMRPARLALQRWAIGRRTRSTAAAPVGCWAGRMSARCSSDGGAAGSLFQGEVSETHESEQLAACRRSRCCHLPRRSHRYRRRPVRLGRLAVSRAVRRVRSPSRRHRRCPPQGRFRTRWRGP
jgi:hypothetical protein